MAILQTEEINEKEWKKRTDKIKNLTEQFFNFLSPKSYYDDEIWVDTRPQNVRNLEKTGEMYELEQKNRKEEAEMMWKWLK